MMELRATMVDPYFNEIPWEIIYDENGRVLAEIFVIPHYLSARRKINRRVRKWRMQS
ncbi:MAG: hypothetical protein K0Q73_8718 [Paenibacillus sp.]|jgi:hypothetical protein|nr:hypothetical protein [Paenibacillus sp.]